ncbi:MAG: dipeptide ABC transporter ATP-binding protein [Clostridiales bacterium]
MSKFLEVKNLKKYYETNRGTLHAVDGVSFSLEKGETLGVVGESGCGKSTLGQTVLHLRRPTDGEIYFNGEDISNPTKKKRHDLCQHMQIIFQDPFSSLNPRMTVKQIISEPLKIFNAVKNKGELEERVAKLMETVGLAKRFVNTYPHELDGGRRQRIGIARALALEPSFIVCDEPVSALDVSIQAQVLNLMQDLQEQLNLTYIFITHDLSVVKHISNNIMVMYLGVVVEHTSSQSLFAAPLHPYTQALLSAIPHSDIDMPRERILLRGEISSPIEPPPGCRFAKRCNYATEKCFTEDPVMEEIYPGHEVACHNVKEINAIP